MAPRAKKKVRKFLYSDLLALYAAQVNAEVKMMMRLVKAAERAKRAARKTR